MITISTQTTSPGGVIRWLYRNNEGIIEADVQTTGSEMFTPEELVTMAEVAYLHHVYIGFTVFLDHNLVAASFHNSEWQIRP